MSTQSFYSSCSQNGISEWPHLSSFEMQTNIKLHKMTHKQPAVYDMRAGKKQQSVLRTFLIKNIFITDNSISDFTMI